MSTSLATEWNDNINISKTNELSDFILRPRLQLNSSYPLTQINLLQLNVVAGYDKYLQHDLYSTYQIESGSQLSFDTYIKDILINLHDRFDYTQDAATQAAVTGTGTFGTAHNTAGVLVTWNPRDLNLSLGYDHQTTMSLVSQFNSLDNSSELIDARAGWRFIPTATAGVEVSCFPHECDQMILNNNDSYTFGVYGEWHPGSYFNVSTRAGVTMVKFQNTSQSGEIFEIAPDGTPIVVMTGKPIQTSDLLSYYADLTLTHDISEALSYSLSVGHEIQQGVQSDAIEDSYARLSMIWKIIRVLDINNSISYEHGQNGAGNVSGNFTENFDYFTGGVQVGHQFTKDSV